MTLRITGVDRSLMFLCKAARKYWAYYNPAYKDIKKAGICNGCGKYVGWVEVDHNPPLGSRPRTIEEFADWWNRLHYGPVVGLCKKHHLEKTRIERAKRKKK